MSAHACNTCGAEPHMGHTRGCKYNPLNMEAARAVGDTSYAEAKRMYAEPMDPALGEAYYPEGRPAGIRIADAIGESRLTPEERFVTDVLAEVRKARAAFPSNGSLALGEESGEAQRALLHILEGKGGESGLYLECVQTAAMALRLALEAADRMTWKGNAPKGCGGSYEVGSGGHVPGTPGEGCPSCDRDYGDKDAPPPRFPRRAD